MPSEIEFFFDIASPYSYLASTQIAGLSERTGVAVRWKPFLLGGVFKASGNAPPAGVAARARYMARDLVRWAERYEVPYRFPDRFPGNSLTAQRMLLAAGAAGGDESIARLAATFYRFHWAENGDIGDREALVALGDAAGFDGADLLAATQEPAIKAQLIALTEDAVSRGAFGAPTFFHGGELFFGNDRMSLLEDAVTHAAG